MRSSICICGLVLLGTMSSVSMAGITLGSPILVSNSGLGFGAAPPVLTLDADPDEAGGVSWNGSADVETGNVIAAKTETVRAGDITGGVPNLGIAFNMNEAGQPPKSLSLDSMTVSLYYADGTLFESATATPGYLEEPGGGQGGDGYFFPLTQMTNELDIFFSDPDNRLGISASITGSEAGAESFRVATAIPEPNAFLLLTLVVGAGCVCNRRRAIAAMG